MRLFVLLIMLLVESTAFGGEIEAFLFARSKEITTGVEIVELGKSKYIVSVGKAIIDNSKPKSKLNAIRLSKQRAEENALKFIQGSQLVVSEVVKTKIADEKVEELTDLVYSEKLRSETGIYQDLGYWVVDETLYTSISYTIFD